MHFFYRSVVILNDAISQLETKFPKFIVDKLVNYYVKKSISAFVEENFVPAVPGMLFVYIQKRAIEQVNSIFKNIIIMTIMPLLIYVISTSIVAARKVRQKRHLQLKHSAQLTGCS